MQSPSMTFSMSARGQYHHHQARRTGLTTHENPNKRPNLLHRAHRSSIVTSIASAQTKIVLKHKTTGRTFVDASQSQPCLLRPKSLRHLLRNRTIHGSIAVSLSISKSVRTDLAQSRHHRVQCGRRNDASRAQILILSLRMIPPCANVAAVARLAMSRDNALCYLSTTSVPLVEKRATR